ncbi:solute carrier family 35 member G1 [Aplochiton taeniatus]
MGDSTSINNSLNDRELSVVPYRDERVTVVLDKVDDDECDDERTTERIYLQNSSHVHFNNHDDVEGERRSAKSSDSKPKQGLCPSVLCCTNKSSEDPNSDARNTNDKDPEKRRCPGLGLFYGLLSTVFFSVIALLVKTIRDVHAVEISLVRCFFQMLFLMPLLIYHRTGFLGPRDKRLFLFLRGLLGSNAMILLFYAVQQMPLADATVIMFSNPVFTSLLAWIFLKEKCTLWDCLFTVFTLTGVILIARPPFLFGERVSGIESDYARHLKGTAAAFAGALGAACTFVLLRKMGKSVHYYLSVWYYAVIGFLQCLVVLAATGQWTLPPCGYDRWIMMLIAVLGIAGQTFLTKALQIEKAGAVSLMRTVDVLLAFVFQFLFFGHAPTWWSLGGALCVVVSTSGVVIQKWYASNSRKT